MCAAKRHTKNRGTDITNIRAGQYLGQSRSPTNGFPSQAPATGQLRVGVRASVTGEMSDDAFVMGASVRGDALGAKSDHPIWQRLRERRAYPYNIYAPNLCVPVDDMHSPLYTAMDRKERSRCQRP